MSYYKACFNYSGDIPKGANKDRLEQLFVGIHNAFAKRSEENYKRWNKEWDNVKERGLYSDSDYVAFIQNCMDGYFRKMLTVTPNLESTLNKEYIARIFAGDECDLRLQLVNGTELDLEFEEVKGL